MLYDFPNSDQPIRQGDIFRAIPRLDVDLTALDHIGEDDQSRRSSWRDLVLNELQAPVVAFVAIRPVTAIVITQDCDAVRAPEIALCEIGLFREIELKAKETKAAKSWVNIITQHARVNQKWFYLPPDETVGFGEKMAADFRTVLRVGQSDLEDMRVDFRVGRLNDVAVAHFRERVGEFFRRYPYDEWYPLNKEELDAYRNEKSEPIHPYDWQT